jgi:two-component system KDP operon response regulator KdpE
MNATILIVEDEREIRRLLSATLEANGFSPLEAENARAGRLAVAGKRPDLVILDLGLPDQDGQDFIVDLREWSRVPVIVLSAREQEAEKVAALENGADDYLTKPFAAGELIARIRVALRHAVAGAGEATPVHAFGDLVVDLSARSVRLAGEERRLTPIEYKLLATLVQHAGKVLTYTQLSRDIWGRHAADGNQRLRIHAQHLREKLNDDPISPRFILTEPGIGYRFCAEPSV